MTDDRPPSNEPPTPDERERRRRRARVFGDVLPEQTRDDVTDDQAAEGSDEWLRRQKPPHHG